MKIHSPYSAAINEALSENLEAAEFVSEAEAEIILPALALPLKLGEIIDFITSYPRKINIAGLKLDLSQQVLSLNGKTLKLTAKEAAILEYLAKTKAPVAREAMLGDIWSYSGDADTKTVENHIYRLRQKILKEFGREIIASQGSNYKLMEN